MNRFNYQINESNYADAIDLGFVNTSDFSSNYVETSLFESQDSFLNTIEPINGSQDSSLFLNPIYEILGENVYEKDFCSDQTSVPTTTHEKNKLINSSWEIKEATHASVRTSNEFSRDMVTHNCGTEALPQPRIASAVDVCNLSDSTEQSIFLSDHHELPLPEYNVPGAGYTSTMNQWYLNLEQQQQRMSFMNVSPLSNMNHLQTIMSTVLNDGGKEFNQNFSENLLNTVVSVPSYNSVTPPVTGDCSKRAKDIVNHNTFDDSRSVYENGTNDTTIVLPMSVTNSIQQHDQGCSTKTSSRSISQPFFQTDLSLGSNQQSHNCRNISTGDNAPFAVTNLRSVANINCSKNIKRTSNSESIYQSKSFIDQQLHSDASRQLPLMGLGQTKNHNWAAVFPRTNFIYPPETIVMHPLRTRKLNASRRITSTNLEVTSSEAATSFTAIAPKSIFYPEGNKSLNRSNTAKISTDNIQKSQETEDMRDDRNNLSEYFDTTSINIPMIKERSRTDMKTENRRKQKLHIIPGAENLVFEVHGNDTRDTDDFIQIQTTSGEQNKTINMIDNEDPYPESELPELDDIFRRKKKTNSTAAAGSKRTYQISQSIAVGNVSFNKKHCPNSIVRQQPTVAIIKPSESLRKNISVSIAIRRAKPNSVGSESDTAESIDDDADDCQSQAGRSLKCNKCKKLFKTTRSLAIHTKRCVNLDQQKTVVSEDGNNNLFFNNNPDIDGTINNSLTDAQLTEYSSDKEIQSQKPSLKSNNIQDLNVACYMCKKTSLCELAKGNPEKSMMNLLPNNKKHPRPITRSQTRRSAGRSISYSAFAKHSK